MNEFEVTCITKSSLDVRNDYVTHIGNQIGSWCLTREIAIQRIESKQESYYTTDLRTGKKAYLGVVRETGKQPYLRTHADGTWNDNLLALPECTGCRLVA